MDVFRVHVWSAFRDLNPDLDCSRLGPVAYRLAPVSAGLHRMALRSLRVKRGFYAPTSTSSALRTTPARRRLSLEILREERAMPALVWLFTPWPESEERVARQ